jgi:prepilin-type N-terminal cleavage/methylation domain-containing protein
MSAKSNKGFIRSSRQRRRGFTLTEIAIVLGVVGLILGAIWVAAAAVYNNLRVSHTNTQILQTAQAIRTLYSSQNTITSGDMTPDLIISAAVPEDMVKGTTLIDAWGGNLWIEGTADNVGFYIEVDKVPQAACINLVTAVGGVARDPGLFLATAVPSTGAEVPAGTTTPALTTTVDPSTASTGCPANAGTLATVEFGFLLKG